MQPATFAFQISDFRHFLDKKAQFHVSNLVRESDIVAKWETLWDKVCAVHSKSKAQITPLLRSTARAPTLSLGGS